jgi:uncharacterized protein YdbL (DUF1318 family)
MMRSPLNTAIMALAGILLCGVAAAGQGDMKALKEEMSQRYPTIELLKRQDKVGETWDGYLAPLKDGNRAEELVFENKKTTIGKFIDAENATRKAVYTIIAKERSTETETVTPEQVGELSGTDFLKRRSKPGDWFLKKDGKWVQKSQRR